MTKWYCDECGDAIEPVGKGYVIWNPRGSKSGGFRIIHQSKCDRNEYSSSAALADFLGDKGAAHLMSMLSYGPIRRALGSKATPKLDGVDEFVDFFRRVQTPYYEEARRYFSSQQVRDDFADANEVLPYLPETLKSVIKGCE